MLLLVVKALTRLPGSDSDSCVCVCLAVVFLCIAIDPEGPHWRAPYKVLLSELSGGEARLPSQPFHAQPPSPWAPQARLALQSAHPRRLSQPHLHVSLKPLRPACWTSSACCCFSHTPSAPAGSYPLWAFKALPWKALVNAGQRLVGLVNSCTCRPPGLRSGSRLPPLSCLSTQDNCTHTGHGEPLGSFCSDVLFLAQNLTSKCSVNAEYIFRPTV